MKNGYHHSALQVSKVIKIWTRSQKEAYIDSILLPLHCQYLQTRGIPLYMPLPYQHCQTIKWMAPYSNSSQIVTRNTAAVSYLRTIRNSHLSCGLVCRPRLDRMMDTKWQQTRHMFLYLDRQQLTSISRTSRGWPRPPSATIWWSAPSGKYTHANSKRSNTDTHLTDPFPGQSG